MPNRLGEFSAFSAPSAVQTRGADGPNNEDRQRGGTKNWRIWRPSPGGLKNAVVPDLKTENRKLNSLNVRITKAIMRGVARNDRLERLGLATSKTRSRPHDEGNRLSRELKTEA
jgi:hypothetical protein